MFRGFLSLSAGFLALLCVIGIPGRLHAQLSHAAEEATAVAGVVRPVSAGEKRRIIGSAALPCN